jgi:hypothetical protein
MEPAARIWENIGKREKVRPWGEHPIWGMRRFRISKSASQADPDVMKSRNKIFSPGIASAGDTATASMRGRRAAGDKYLKTAAESFFNHGLTRMGADENEPERDAEWGISGPKHPTTNIERRTSNFTRLIIAR